VTGYRDVDTDDYDEDEYDPDDFYDDGHWEPDEADYAYEKWRYDYEEHCEQAHGGNDCDCRAPLGERIRECFRSARRRVRAVLHRTRYSDEPPF
jgi:hypothetical protein